MTEFRQTSSWSNEAQQPDIRLLRSARAFDLIATADELRGYDAMGQFVPTNPAVKPSFANSYVPRTASQTAMWLIARNVYAAYLEHHAHKLAPHLFEEA